MNRSCAFLLILSLWFVGIAQGEELQIGVAQIDVTPDYPIRLNGFAKRKTESDGVLGRILCDASGVRQRFLSPAVHFLGGAFHLPDLALDLVRRVAGGLSVELLCLAANILGAPGDPIVCHGDGSFYAQQRPSP